jgi:hypothetical protein
VLLAPVAACAEPGGQAHDGRRRLKSELAEHAGDVFLVPYLGELAVARWWDMYLAGPPVTLQRALFAALGPLARLRGYRASYGHFSPM